MAELSSSCEPPLLRFVRFVTEFGVTTMPFTIKSKPHWLIRRYDDTSPSLFSQHNGKQITDFYKNWKSAISEQACVLTFHCLAFYSGASTSVTELTTKSQVVFHSRSSLELLKRQKNSKQSSSILVPNPKSSVPSLIQTKNRDDIQVQNQSCKDRLNRAFA